MQKKPTSNPAVLYQMESFISSNPHVHMIYTN